jgi:hypothetical protein
LPELVEPALDDDAPEDELPVLDTGERDVVVVSGTCTST